MAISNCKSCGCGCRQAAQGSFYSGINYTPPAYMACTSAPLSQEAYTAMANWAGCADQSTWNRRRPGNHGSCQNCQKPCCLPDENTPPPYYDGPCPPPPGGYPAPVPLTAHAYFAELGSLATAAGGAIELDDVQSATADITIDGGVITLTNRGRYLVTYVVSVPAETAVSTTLSLLVNGQYTAPGSVQYVETDGDGNAATFVGQTMINLPVDNVTLELVSSEALSWTAESDAATTASISIIRLL